jgi:capsular polysaccharide transport system permease protein
VKGALGWLSARNLRVVILVLPLLGAVLYLWLLAADRYVAESVVTVRDSSEAVGGMDGLASLFSGAASNHQKDLLMLRSHIESIDMLRQVDAKLDVRSNFSAPTSDVLFRMAPDSSQEKFLEYYRNRLELVYDDQAALLLIRTQAFTPEMAVAINKEVLQLSEHFINESSHRLARDQMAFAELELKAARTRMDAAKTVVLEFQNKHGVLDPTAQAAANTGLTAELQATLARQEAELTGLRGYLNDSAHQVRALRMQINGTRQQLAAESRRGLSNRDGTQLNVLAVQYQQLLGDVQFAQDNYTLALTGLEAARIESTRKLKSLVLVASPVPPESAEHPHRAYLLAAFMLGLGLLYGIARLVVATIEDHQE